MKRSKRGLHRRYGRSVGKASVRALKYSSRLDQYTTGLTGDQVEVGGEAANQDYLIAYRVRHLYGGWKRLGPHAVVAKSALKESQ